MSHRDSCIAVLFCALVLVGCDSRAVVPAGPSTPVQVSNAAPPAGSTTSWVATRTVQSVTGSGPCVSGNKEGDTATGILWAIDINGKTIVLDENMRNWPTDDVLYTGTLDGLQFSAANPEQPGGVCQFRGSTLTGNFNADFSTFQATETVTLEAQGTEMTVQSHWTGTRQ